MTSGKLILTCLVISDDPELFEVDIDESSSVAGLKKAIKNEKPNSLEGYDADELDLWRVSLPYEDYCTQGAIKKLALEDRDALCPGYLLSHIFVVPLEKEHLHIVAMLPFSSECA